jgi:CheY-like chemotaxis protein
MIQSAGIDTEITAVETRKEFVRRLKGEDWDVIMSDESLPAFDGLEAMEIAATTCPETPFIFVSCTWGEEIAVESLPFSES